ncbi:MAG: Ig-like domain-containing protein [Gemmatimonadota bacterium]
MAVLITRAFTLPFVIGITSACDEKRIADPEPVTIAIAPADTSIAVGQTARFRTVTSGNAEQVHWRSTNANVATVDSEGVARALGAGSTLIIGSAAEVADTAQLTVLPLTGTDRV